jgi:hypothetical protein
MKKWMLCVVLVLALPALACSFSIGMDGETPEPAVPTTPAEALPTPAAPPPTTPAEVLPTPMPPTPTMPAATGPRLYDIFFSSEITDDEQPLSVATEFPPGTAAVYGFASYEGMVDGAQCESVWYLDGDEVARTPFVWSGGDRGGPVMIAYVQKEGGLPSGAYDWEIYADGGLLVTARFPVTGVAPALFEDDFSDPSSGWEVGDYSDGSLGYSDGGYLVTATLEDTYIWGVANQFFSDIVIEVDATELSAPANDNNAYGVMCRVQPNGKDGYALRISGDGYYAIHLISDGFEALVDWTASDAIRQGNATNHLRAVCDGSSLVLFVNGELVAEASDTTFTEGDIALSATTFEAEPTEVLFDNLVVSRAAAP